MTGKFQHPGFPNPGGIPDPRKVRNELDLLMKRFKQLEEKIKREKDQNQIKALKKEKAEIGQKLFWILKPV